MIGCSVRYALLPVLIVPALIVFSSCAGAPAPAPVAPKPARVAAETEELTLKTIRSAVANVHVVYSGKCQGADVSMTSGGTAFRLGPNVFMTAEHVVAKQMTVSCGEGEVALSRSSLRLLLVKWSADALELEDGPECLASVVAEDAPRDMALLTFSFSQKECVGGGPVSLYIDPRLLDKFQMMGKLVGVGFPSEDWLLLRTVSGLVDQSDWRRKYPQKLKEYSFDRVLGSHGSVPSMIITDSEPVPGDSGSPLLDAKTLSVVGMIVQRVKGHGYAVPAKSLSDFAGSHLGAIAVESLDSASTNQFAVEVSQGSGLPGQQDWVRISERDLLEPGDYRIRVVGSRFDYGGEIQVRNRMRHRVVALPRSGTSLEQLLEILY